MPDYTIKMMRPFVPDEDPAERILKKNIEYYNAAKYYRILYYATRLIGGLCAAIIPFIISSSPDIATILSIIIVVITVFDTVFNPKERWKSLSRATDLLYVTALKKAGKYQEFEDQLKIILSTEDQKMLELIGLDEIIKKAQKAGKKKSKKVYLKSRISITRRLTRTAFSLRHFCNNKVLLAK